jgi:hypothetical protein
MNALAAAGTVFADAADHGHRLREVEAHIACRAVFPAGGDWGNARRAGFDIPDIS